MNSNIAQSTNADRRQDARDGVIQQAEPANFYVEFIGQKVPLMSIRDVSISGIGLVLGRIIAPGETIELGCTADDMDLKIKGKIAWCDTDSNPAAHGVEFDRETLQENILFFMATRKFLDNFDGTTVDI